MTRFLAIYHGVASELDKKGLSEEQQSEFMNAWAAWAQAHQESLVDPGAPLYMKKLVTAHGVEDFTDSKTGYAVVAAGSHDEAVRIFAEHPHLRLISAELDRSVGVSAGAWAAGLKALYALDGVRVGHPGSAAVSAPASHSRRGSSRS